MKEKKFFLLTENEKSQNGLHVVALFRTVGQVPRDW